MITLDEKSKEILIERLKGDASKANEKMYMFAIHLYDEFHKIDWSNSRNASGDKITQMSILEELAQEPNMPSNDAGALRQMKRAGDFINQAYDGSIEKVSKIQYWKFHDIARAKLVKQDDILDLEAKKKIIDDVISGKVKTGKIRAEIKRIKFLHEPGALKDLIQVYNQWSFSSPDPRFGNNDWPGRIPGQIVLNVIYHYFDRKNKIRVLDPLSGGGSTHDVCKYLSSLDIQKQINKAAKEKESDKIAQEFMVIDELEVESEQYDIEFMGFDIDPISIDSEYFEPYLVERNGIKMIEGKMKPRNIIKKDSVLEEWNAYNQFDLVFMDPPYYNQVGEKYLANPFTESRESFYNAMRTMIKKSYDALVQGGMLAIIISPQTEKSIDFKNDEVCMDMPYEVMKIMEQEGFKHYNRIQVPLATQQFAPQDVERVKQYEQRDHLLGTARDLILMKK